MKGKEPETNELKMPNGNAMYAYLEFNCIGRPAQIPNRFLISEPVPTKFGFMRLRISHEFWILGSVVSIETAPSFTNYYY
jgi:hypothetical protein